MLGGKGSTWFQARLREHEAKLLRERFRPRKRRLGPPSGSVPDEVALVLFASALVGVISWWLEGGMRYSASQVATWFRRIARNGYVGMLAGAPNGRGLRG